MEKPFAGSIFVAVGTIGLILSVAGMYVLSQAGDDIGPLIMGATALNVGTMCFIAAAIILALAGKSTGSK